VFVNSKSGGQTGNELMKELTRLLDKQQMFDLNTDKGAIKGYTSNAHGRECLYF
jgi:hypothetical protein